MKQVLYLLFLLPNLLTAQFSDNFSDGDFLKNPSWEGDTGAWVVLNAQLKSNGPAVTPSVLYLSTPSSLAYDCQWEFFVNTKLATSSGNYMDVFLISDQKNLNSNLNGYFVRIGGTKDEISLFKKQGAILTKIIDGKDKFLSSASNNPSKIKVIRNKAYQWTLEVDNTGSGSSYDLQGSITDSSFNSSNYFGMLIHYSAANSKKYFFDDCYVGPIIIDSIPPFVSSLKLVSSNELDVYFNEPVNQVIAEDPLNYFELGEVGNPAEANRDNANAALVHLSFANPFPSGQPDSISIKNITDLANNQAIRSINYFLYYRAKQHDVVFNELMPDPSPNNQLPEREYIELKNNTEFPINISNWSLSCGNSVALIPEAILLPDSFIVLCNNDAFLDLEHLGNVVALAELSPSALINGGTTLSLSDKTGALIHAVSYTDKWYGNDSKKEGGWALEQIDPTNFCAGSNNWIASIDQTGGTPGRTNSVKGINKDVLSPKLLRAVIIDDITVKLYFNESLNINTLLNPLNYYVDHEIGNPVQLSVSEPDLSCVLITLSKPLSSGNIYVVSVNENITDCVGNNIEKFSKATFAVAEKMEKNDVIINEVLFNPKLNGVDFVEIYNRSSKIIDLKEIQLSTIDEYSNSLSSAVNIDSIGYLFFPHDYLVLTIDKENILNNYHTENQDGFVELFSMPSFGNQEGKVIINKANGEIIDQFNYSEKMQFPLLNSLEGVSLERVNPDRSSKDLTNWHSASEEAGFASPAAKNSQHLNPTKNTNTIFVEPLLFSPDNDGNHDLIDINYTFDIPGKVANITIYDDKGKAIRFIVKNELLGTTGTFSWDGLNESKEKCPIGSYIIYFAVFDLAGVVSDYKYNCFLAGKL